MSLLYGKLNKELKLLGSVQAQLHTHVNMFICKPLDYIITGSSNCLREPLWQLRSSRDCGILKGKEAVLTSSSQTQGYIL